MIVLSWNCQELSGLSAIPNLRNLSQGYKLDIRFRSKTLATSRKMESVRVSLKYDACLTVEVEGRSGGLAVIWTNNINGRVLNYSRKFVNLVIEDDEKGQWRFTCYYGYPKRSRRKQFMESDGGSYPGVSWRIEDGCRINVMSEPWLRSEGKRWASAPRGQEMYTMKVANLML
ncbi:hypothetical protein KIW84_057382 [Lathyrus oleraceus]|uniref:Uncharacterized protein n=1 Tax=Pisum sativum TaxID=3888 RepID=A0A9D4X0X4_PEA|nr:hypothetical protein KIW84_057382 [Pisum sativum]